MPASPLTSEPETEQLADAWAQLIDADHDGITLSRSLEISESTLQRAETLGFQLYKQGDYTRSEKIARGLIALEPDRRYGYSLLGQTLLRRGIRSESLPHEDLVEARVAFENVLQLEPDRPTARLNLARLCFLSGDDERARQLLEKLSDHEDATVSSQASGLLGVVKRR